MKKKHFHIVLGLLAGIFVLSCAGKQKSQTEMLLEGMDDDVDLVSDLTGIDENSNVPMEQDEDDEAPSSDVPETPTEGAGDMIGGSRGAFVGRLVIAGQDINGRYTVKRATVSNEIVKENVPAGSEIKLDPGRYDFIFTTDEVLGSPELTLRDVEIEAGRRIKRDVKMPVGQITLKTGAKCSKKPIKIKPKGATDWYKGKFYTCVPIKLMAGNYEAEMKSGKKGGTPISGIQVYDGGIREILIRNQ